MVLELHINLCILKLLLVFLKQLSNMPIWNTDWYAGLWKCFYRLWWLNFSICLQLFHWLILQGKMEDAFSLYEHAIAIEKGKEHSQTLPMLFAQYSRFVYLVCSITYLHCCLLTQYSWFVYLVCPVASHAICSLFKAFNGLDMHFFFNS